ncbi:MAG TPA: 1,6-dihydroxycyclohexa-2,4-diene-1-carboxylate dehydrogenase [Paenalcaligenes sp.]|nr:1,6-dihydroxycyclohexa-2,4-diene-1-carboxylate dehydrogenase [Paenalcaligenes sp.]
MKDRNKRFSDRVVLVTGAAQGIGREVAVNMHAEDALVVAVDRSELVYELKQELSGERIITVTADLEHFEGAEKIAALAQQTFGRIDVLVNNVGGTIWTRPFEFYGAEQIEKEIQRSLFPTLWCCRAVLPYMLEQKSGAIVNVSSIATRSINRVPYGAAKGGVDALTACLAFETAERGIRVNAVAPGGTEAPARRIPRNETQIDEQEKQWYQQIVDQTIDSTLMKRYGTLQEQTDAILFLASDEASYITGTVLPVGGGDQG